MNEAPFMRLELIPSFNLQEFANNGRCVVGLTATPPSIKIGPIINTCVIMRKGLHDNHERVRARVLPKNVKIIDNPAIWLKDVAYVFQPLPAKYMNARMNQGKTRTAVCRESAISLIKYALEADIQITAIYVACRSFGDEWDFVPELIANFLGFDIYADACGGDDKHTSTFMAVNIAKTIRDIHMEALSKRYPTINPKNSNDKMVEKSMRSSFDRVFGYPYLVQLMPQELDKLGCVGIQWISTDDKPEESKLRPKFFKTLKVRSANRF